MAKEKTSSGENDTATAAAMPATIVENNATDSTAAEGLEEEEAAADLDGKKRRKKRSTIKINTIKSTPYILLIMINNDNLICTLFLTVNAYNVTCEDGRMCLVKKGPPAEKNGCVIFKPIKPSVKCAWPCSRINCEPRLIYDEECPEDTCEPAQGVKIDIYAMDQAKIALLAALVGATVVLLAGLYFAIGEIWACRHIGYSMLRNATSGPTTSSRRRTAAPRPPGRTRPRTTTTEEDAHLLEAEETGTTSFVERPIIRPGSGRNVAKKSSSLPICCPATTTMASLPPESCQFTLEGASALDSAEPSAPPPTPTPPKKPEDEEPIYVQMEKIKERKRMLRLDL